MALADAVYEDFAFARAHFHALTSSSFSSLSVNCWIYSWLPPSRSTSSANRKMLSGGPPRGDQFVAERSRPIDTNDSRMSVSSASCSASSGVQSFSVGCWAIKVFCVIFSKLVNQAQQILVTERAGFRWQRGTNEQIFIKLKAVGGIALWTSEWAISQLHLLRENIGSCMAWQLLVHLKRKEHPIGWLKSLGRCTTERPSEYSKFMPKGFWDMKRIMDFFQLNEICQVQVNNSSLLFWRDLQSFSEEPFLYNTLLQSSANETNVTWASRGHWYRSRMTRAHKTVPCETPEIK